MRDARTRARRRLIGAVVLLVIGVIGFPLVFESQPRPIPVDIPIEIPKKEGAPALTMPAARLPAAAAPKSGASDATVPPMPSPSADEVITESPADAGREVSRSAAAALAASAAERAAAKPAAKPATAAAAKPATTATAAEAQPRSTAASAAPTGANAAAETATLHKSTSPAAALPSPALADGARAKALLDAKTPVPAQGTRFVVQVGAFAEADAARETRVKAEKLGLKTYTQVAQTPSGSRIRVRVGPFATRAEADAALAKARGAGLTAVVLTL